MRTLLISLCIIYNLINECLSASSVNPTWQPSTQYFEAYPADIKLDINTFFDQNSPITKTFNFVKAYTQIPQLAYGLKNYRGIFYFYVRN